MSSPRHETDAVIIGAGPVGLYAVFTLGMVRLKAHLVEALASVGGQLTALYPEKPIYDIPGFPRILAADLVERLAEQAAPFHPQHHLDVTVETLVQLPDGRWEVGLSNGEAIVGRVVLIAAGAGAFGPHRPPLPRLAEFEGSSVAYYVRRRDDYAGQRVVIAGGGDSAVDWALSLCDLAERVMVVHRRAKFRAAPEAEARLQALAAEGRLDLVVPAQLHALEGADGRLEAVVVADFDGQTRRLPADRLLCFFGLAGHLGPIAQWGLAMEGAAITVDPATLATSLPGVFALGDIARYPGKLKLIAQGFSEAAMAAQAAYGVVHPGESRRFPHSTTTGLPEISG